jgi:hypothetical protein
LKKAISMDRLKYLDLCPLRFEAPPHGGAMLFSPTRGVPRLNVWDITETTQEPSEREAMITYLSSPSMTVL